MLLAPFLYAIKYARVNFGFSEDICVYATASYFVLAAIYMASGWIARADLMYKYFLRSASQHRVTFEMLHIAYIVGLSLIAGLYYLVNFREVVSMFLYQGNLIRILKLFVAVPFSVMSTGALILHALAICRGSLRWKNKK